MALGGELGGRGEPTQHIVNRTLLAKSSQTVQHAPHPSPESAGLQEGPAGERAHGPGCSPAPWDPEPQGGVTHLDCCRQCKRKVTRPVVSARSPKRLRRSPCGS